MMEERTERDLTGLPVFGPEYAECHTCELQPQCAAGQTATAYRPERFNGVMIVGEGPGHHEVAKNEPFVGRAGQLLEALLKSAGLERNECYLTNATLCKPPPVPDKKGFHENFPHAIYSCLPRLEAEIEAVRPKVVLAFGNAALIAATGYEEQKTTRRPWVTEENPNGCPTCHEARKLDHVVECSAKNKETDQKCGYVTWWEMESDGPAQFGAESRPAMRLKAPENPRIVTVEPTEEQLARLRSTPCPGCGAKRAKVKPKKVNCPACDGKKTYPITLTHWRHDYKISEVAGAVFLPEKTWGRWDELGGVRFIVPTYHPSFLLRPPPENKKVMAGQFAAPPVVRHLQKVKRLLAKESLDDVTRCFITTDPEEVLDYVYGPADNEKPTLPNYVLDIETSAWVVDPITGEVSKGDARDPYQVTEITVVGIGTSTDPEGEMCVVDTRSPNPKDPKALPDPALVQALKTICEDPEVPKTLVNGAYDVIVLHRMWGIQVVNWEEVMVAHHNLYPNEDHELSHMAFTFLDIEPWKPPKSLGEDARAHEDYAELALYNARDLRHTEGVRHALGIDQGRAILGGLVARERLAPVYELDTKMARIAAQMTVAGLPTNREAMMKVGVEAKTKAATEHMKMCAILNDPAFQPSKRAHLEYALFDPRGPLRLVPPGKTKTGYSTSKDDLAKLAEHPFVQALLRWREHDKIVNTYILGKGFQIREDGRMHPSWKVTVVVTGRWSSSPNFQNWPEWLRAVVETAPDRVIIGFDYDQLEIRILAGICGDPELLRRCLEADEKRKLEPEADPHSFLGSHVFGQTFTNLSLADPAHDKSKKCKCETCTRKELRNVSKTVFYAINYGGGAQTIHANIYKKGYDGPPIGVETVIRTMQTIDRIFPGIPAYRQDLMREVTAAREVRSELLGRRRIYPLGDISFTEVVNYPIQATAADIMNGRFALLVEELPKVDPTAFPIAQVHDAVYFEASRARAREVAKLVEDVLTCEVTFPRSGITVPFTGKAKIGDNWKAVS